MIAETENQNNPETLVLFKDSTKLCKEFVSIPKDYDKFNVKNCYGESVQIDHWQEWVNGSGISPFVASLNLESHPENPNTPLYDRLLISEKITRRNPGQLTTGYLKRYGHLELGGWASFGVDVLSSSGEESLWGVVKPDCPIKDREEKIIKYEVPPKIGTEIFAPKLSFLVSWHLVRKYPQARKSWILRLLRCLGREEENISKEEYQAIEREVFSIYKSVWWHSNTISVPTVLLQEDKGFYNYLKTDSTIPITLTEGNKKAAKLVTEGYVSLSVPGVFNGYRKETGKLIPQLQTFATPQREWNICFDNDNKPSTIANVKGAIAKTGKLLEKEGCKVNVLQWRYPEKGIDDLIVKRGSEVFEEIYDSRFTLSYFLFKNYHEQKLLKLEPNLVQNNRYLENFDSKNVPIVGIKAPKGTGKTELLCQKVAEARDENRPALVLTHRIQLTRTLCDRFGIDHIEEIRLSETGGVLGYGLCVDSAHGKSKARFNPQDWSNAIVIVDEAEQVFWHTLDSKTCKYNRVAIIENLTELFQHVIRTKGQIFLSDADLSPISIEYVQTLSKCKTPPLIVENLWEKETKIPLTIYEQNDPRRMVLDLLADLKNGKKAFLQTSGQKIKSKWGTQNLEKYFKKKLKANNLKILRIDAESVADPNHSAFGCIKNLDHVLSQYDLVIASPVIETGVSIDLKKHFDRGWCIAYGVQTVDSVCQSVERVREGIPRSLWAINKCPQYKIGNGATYPSHLMGSQQEQARANISLLLQPDGETEQLGAISLSTWAKRACINNAQRDFYRDAIVSKLLKEGYELEDRDNNADKEDKDLSQEIKECRDKSYQEENEAIANTTAPTNEQLKILQAKRRKTQQERREQRKGELKEDYGNIKVTPELIEKDDKGWLKQLKLHFYLTVGKGKLLLQDRKYLAILSDFNNKAFIPDINKTLYSAKIAALEFLQIDQFLNLDTLFSASKLRDWHKLMVGCRWQIKQLFGVSIHPERDSAIAVAQRILKKLGLKLKNIGWRNRERIYQLSQIDDQRKQIFSFWSTT